MDSCLGEMRNKARQVELARVESRGVKSAGLQGVFDWYKQGRNLLAFHRTRGAQSPETGRTVPSTKNDPILYLTLWVPSHIHVGEKLLSNSLSEESYSLYKLRLFCAILVCLKYIHLIPMSTCTSESPFSRISSQNTF